MTEHAIKQFSRKTLNELKSAGRDFSAHSIFSPSGSAMWAYCSGSLLPNLFINDTAGEDAAYGTVGHGIGEQWLKTGECPEHLIGTTEIVVEGDKSFEIEIDSSMMEYVEQYVDWCLYLPGVHFVEVRVDFSDLTPLTKQQGTSDHAVCEIGKLTITDLKMGKGIKVFAEKNTQAIIYAYGFFKAYDEMFDFQTIVIRIAQPRLDHFDEWVITREELLQWAAWIKERAFAAWCNDGERTPGLKQCQWCKIKRDCAAHVVFMESLLDGQFDNLDAPITTDAMVELTDRLDSGIYDLRPPQLGTLTTEHKSVLLAYQKLVEGFFADVRSDLEARCLAGEHVPGQKIVIGKSNRVFSNDDDAAAELDFLGLADEVIHPRKMITPAQAETALTKIGYKRKQLPTLLNKVVVKPPGKPTMVSESDPRPAIGSVASESFSNLDDEL